jgi:uncharacterized coiled-coil DUF342 family protein
MPGLEWSWQKRSTDPDDKRNQLVDQLRFLITEARQYPSRRRMALNLAVKKLREYREELVATSDKTVEAYISKLAKTG